MPEERPPSSHNVGSDIKRHFCSAPSGVDRELVVFIVVLVLDVVVSVFVVVDEVKILCFVVAVVIVVVVVRARGGSGGGGSGGGGGGSGGGGGGSGGGGGGSGGGGGGGHFVVILIVVVVLLDVVVVMGALVTVVVGRVVVVVTVEVVSIVVVVLVVSFVSSELAIAVNEGAGSSVEPVKVPFSVMPLPSLSDWETPVSSDGLNKKYMVAIAIPIVSMAIVMQHCLLPFRLRDEESVPNLVSSDAELPL
uniref:Uncharacterized protein n=1 Tax=Trichuris muris TaxID=70415 RepID=A0A5S6R2U3_TRIMR